MNPHIELPRTIAATTTTDATAVAGKHSLVDATANPITVTLPAIGAGSAGAHLSIEKTDATAHAVTVTGNIRGATASLTLNYAHETLELRTDATGAWFPTANHLPKASIDGIVAGLLTAGTGQTATELSATYLAQVVGLATGNTAAAANGAIIQAAINAAAAAGGGEVRIPAGRWYSTPLALKSYVTLSGFGLGTTGTTGSTLVLVNGANTHFLTVSDAQQQQVGLRHIALDGNKSNQTSGDIVHFDQNAYSPPGSSTIVDDDPNHFFDRVLLQNGKGTGLWVQGPRGQAQYRSVLAYHCDGNGFFIDSPDNQLDHCIAASSGVEGFKLWGAQTRVVACKAFLSGVITAQYGVGFWLGGSRIGLTHCEAQDNISHGFSLVNVNDCQVIGLSERNGMGSDYTGNQGDGIYAIGTTNSTIILTIGDRNVGGTLMQRYGYTADTGNDSNIVTLTVAETRSGSVGTGSWGAHSAVTTSYAGTITLPGPASTVVQGLTSGTGAAAANTARIQAAINAAGTAGGGEVVIPAGTWYVSPITMKSNVVLRGFGWSSCLILAAGSNAHMITLATSSVIWTGIRDLMLDGNKGNQTAGAVVYFDNSGLTSSRSDTILDDDPNHSFQRLAILHGKSHGLHLTGSRGQSQIHSVFAYENDGRGISIDSPDNQFAHCIAASNGLQGVYISGNANQTRIVDTKSFFSGQIDPSSNGEGFTVFGQRCELTHVEAQDNTGHGFVIVNVKNLRLSGIAERNGLGAGPTFPGAAADGMYVSGLTDSTISLIASDRNVSGVLAQRWAYNLGGTNTGNHISVISSAMQSGAIGLGDWGPSNFVTSSYAGVAIATGPTQVLANSQTGTTYTLTGSDAGKVIEMTNAAANTLTVPPNSAVSYPVGTVIEVFQGGAGQTTVAAGSGVTLRAPNGARIAAQYGSASLRKRGSDEWVLAGNTST